MGIYSLSGVPESTHIAHEPDLLVALTPEAVLDMLRKRMSEFGLRDLFFTTDASGQAALPAGGIPLHIGLLASLRDFTAVTLTAAPGMNAVGLRIGLEYDIRHAEIHRHDGSKAVVQSWRFDAQACRLAL